MPGDVCKSPVLDKPRARDACSAMLLPVALLPFLLTLLLSAAPARGAAPAPPQSLTEEDALNFHCLRQAYPELHSLEADTGGRQWLVFTDRRRVLYREAPGEQRTPGLPAQTDVAASMAAPYPLEPRRPPTPPGTSPGRLRPYALLAALYGESREGVSAGLVTLPWQGRPVRLSAPAAEALGRVARRLAPVLAERTDLGPYLKSEGGFAWRRIAGEDKLSAHAFGIALDLNARLGPYWRWSGRRPHPRQQDYPPEIVAAFEAEGFIWGGKWHEYDLMHFEYRPELICKARLAGKSRPKP